MTTKEAWEKIAQAFESKDYDGLANKGLCHACNVLFERGCINYDQLAIIRRQILMAMRKRRKRNAFLYPITGKRAHRRTHDLLRAKLARQLGKDSQ